MFVMVRRKKGLYPIEQSNGVHIRNSMVSDDSESYWQQAENCIEMSPLQSHIDIVPLDHYGSMLETSIDVVANHCVNVSEGTYGSTSLRQLINNSPDRGPPKRGGPSPHGARQLQSPSYVDTGTVPTGGTMGGYTSSSMEKSSDYDEDDDEGQLVLPDYDASQAYLSLGLTPLSQLSPDAHTSNDFGFFPSMPPPVAPSTSSIFSTTSSSSSLAMDNPFSLHSGGQSNGGLIDSSMMPDAYPERRSRRNKYDTNPLSQGFPLKLEPVMEQSPPVTSSQFSGKQNGFSSSGQSSEGSPTTVSREQDRFVFPSAVPTPEFSRLSQGRTAMRKRRGSSKENLNVISPRGTSMQGGYGSISSTRHTGVNKPLHSPSQEAKRKRQQAREAEVAKQEEELRRKMEQEEKERRWQHEQRMGRTAREFQFSREGSNPRYAAAPSTSTHNPFEMTNGHGDMNTVLKEAAKFEAIQMLHSAKPHTHQVSSSSQNEESRKWTPRHSRHSSLDETPMGGAHRPERSDSTHLYTTYEHRTHM
jgi:hypothetical protein